MQKKAVFDGNNSACQALLPWFISIVASLFFFYEFIQANMFAAIADNVMRDFHIHADKMTYLSSSYYLSNVLFLLVAGVLLDKYSSKTLILVAMTVSVISTFLFSFVHSYYFAVICRFTTGIGSAFCFLGPVRISSYWFPPRKMAMVTGVIVTIAMTGGMMAQYPMAKLVNALGWRGALFQLGILGIFIFFLMLFGIKDKPSEKKHAWKLKNPWHLMLQAYKNSQNLMAACYTSLMNMAIAVFGAMVGVLYLMPRLAIDKESAAYINTFLFFGVLVGGPIVGYISDKMESRTLPMRIGVVVSLLIVLTIIYGDVSYSMMKWLFFSLGFFTSAQVISYALVAEGSSPEVVSTSVSVVSLITQAGYIIYQNIFSWLLVSHSSSSKIIQDGVYTLGDYNFAVNILPIGLLLALVCSFGVKETFGRHEGC